MESHQLEMRIERLEEIINEQGRIISAQAVEIRRLRDALNEAEIEIDASLPVHD